MAKRESIPFTKNGESYIPPFEYLSPGQYIDSPNKRYRLSVQTDGVVAIYNGSNPIWVANRQAANSSETYNNYYPVTKFLNEYQVILQDGTKKRHWVSITSELENKNDLYSTYAYLQDDGNLVSVAFRKLWSTNLSTLINPFDSSAISLLPGTDLEPGRFYSAGDAKLVFQGDGNLVFYGKDNSVLWASYTHNKGAVRAVMQTDGNFVIYNSNGLALWNTNTAGHEGAYLHIHADGTLSVVSQKLVWASFGFTPYRKPPKPKVSLYGPYSWSWEF